MDLENIIHPGMQREEVFTIEEQNTAIHVGSGSSRVLATPWMIAFMERASHHLLVEHLPEGYTSVGVHVDVRHLAPTPVGYSIRVRSDIQEVNGQHVTFAVSAWDNQEQVGTGLHQRYVIDEARFLKRVEAKRSSQT